MSINIPLLDKVRDTPQSDRMGMSEAEESKAYDGGNNQPEMSDERMNNQESAVENINNTKMGEEEEQEKKGCNWVGWIIRITIILCLLGLAVWVIVDSSRFTGILEDFIDWMEDNPILAPFVFIIVYTLATIFFFPGLILTLGAGFAFNEAYGNVGLAILVGSIAVWCGAMLGSMIAMLVGRYLLREWVGAKARKYKVFGAIDTAIEKEVSRNYRFLKIGIFVTRGTS